MSHEIDMSNNKPAIAYVGDTPWHGLGQELTEDASIDTWKVEAGMDWNIERSPVMFNENPADETYAEFPGKSVLYRSDNKSSLSIVSDKYKIVQPHEVLEFFRDLTEDLGMKLSTAGCLFEGRKFWALADTGMAGKVLGNDEIKGNLLLTSSCDGTSPTIAQFTSVRVVCNNTLQLSLSESGNTRASVKHRTTFSPQDIKKSLGLMHDSWDNFMKSITQLSEYEMSDKAAREFYENLFSKEADSHKDVSKVLTRNVDEVMNIYKNGLGSEMAYGTAFGVLNGVTELLDWHKGGRAADTRVWNSWNGVNANFKSETFDKLMELVS